MQVNRDTAFAPLGVVQPDRLGGGEFQNLTGVGGLDADVRLNGLLPAGPDDKQVGLGLQEPLDLVGPHAVAAWHLPYLDNRGIERYTVHPNRQYPNRPTGGLTASHPISATPTSARSTFRRANFMGHPHNPEKFNRCLTHPVRAHHAFRGI